MDVTPNRDLIWHIELSTLSVLTDRVVSLPEIVEAILDSILLREASPTTLPAMEDIQACLRSAIDLC